jgi:hypothetical protein
LIEFPNGVSNLLESLAAARRSLAAAAFLLCLLTPFAARAENKDVVQFGNDIVVREGEEVHDVVCFLCSIEVDGTVHGDTVAFLGNLRLRGHAERSAVVFLGNAWLGDNASVERDLVVFAGNLHMGSGASIGNDRVVFPLFLFLLPLLFVIGVVAIIVWAVRTLVYRTRPAYPMPPPRY